QGCSRSEYNDLHHDYSPCVWQHRLPEAPEMEQPKRDAPLFPSPLSQSGFHRRTINDALTALTTQPKSACITCTNDPFQESVARIARIQRWGPRPDRSFRNDGTRIRPSAVSAALSGGLLQGAWSQTRFEFYSKRLESRALQSDARVHDRG